jgi:NitT/TauT family transport system substrate-binding protein
VGAGIAGLLGSEESLAAEPPPEITAIRFEKDQVTCVAPEAVAEELLRAEGFTDLRYVESTEEDDLRGIHENSAGNTSMIAHDEVDFARDSAPNCIAGMEAGAPITVLAGLHSGCFEIFGKSDIRTVTDLKGRTVGTPFHSGTSRFLQVMASYVGLDLARDVRWVESASTDPLQLFVEGKIDAFIAYPPDLQRLRSRNIGHTITSSVTDRPWSQYHCCFLTTNTEFARKYPVATKRVLRATLKAVDLCATEPERVARLMVDRGFAARYDYTLQALSEIRYDVWREFDSEDTLLKRELKA